MEFANFTLTRWPLLDSTIWTASTIAVSLIVGHLINRIVVFRLQQLAKKTAGDWDDAVILELRRRVPLWSVLAGVWISIGYWPLDPVHTVPKLRALPLALAVLSVTSAIAATAVRLMVTVTPRVNPEMRVSGLMRNVVRLVIFAVGLLVALREIGVEITPILAALGVGGLAVALALQEPLSNLFAGLFITLAGQIRIGDYVKLEPGPEGVVADFSWNATQLLTPSGNVVIVPNAKLTQAMVTNFHRPSSETGFSVELTVTPGSDLSTVERVALDVAAAVMREVAGGVPDGERTVRFVGFSDLGIRVAVTVRSRDYGDQGGVRHELIKRLHTALTGAGVIIATARTMPASPP